MSFSLFIYHRLLSVCMCVCIFIPLPPLNPMRCISTPLAAIYFPTTPRESLFRLPAVSTSRCNVRGEARRVLGMELDRDHHALFVAFSGCVIRVPLSRCDDYSDCKTWVTSRRAPDIGSGKRAMSGKDKITTMVNGGHVQSNMSL